MYVIGISAEINITEVEGISSPPQMENQTYWITSTFQQLSRLHRLVFLQMCKNLNNTGEKLTYRRGTTCVKCEHVTGYPGNDLDCIWYFLWPSPICYEYAACFFRLVVD